MNAATVRLEVVPRDEFVRDRWDYRAGEHATFIGPTGCGKSHTMMQLLEYTATPQLPAYVLVKKPRDVLLSKRFRELGYPTMKDYPPPPTAMFKKTSGWGVWPPTNFGDPIAGNKAKAATFRRAMLDRYKRGKSIIVADDTYGLANTLGLDRELIELWTEARSMDTGLWAGFQRAAGVPLWAYSQAAHLVLFREPDKKGRARFGEISGVDPDITTRANMALKPHQGLYIRQADAAMCIIDAS